MKDEIKEILDYFQKDVDKYEESKRYLMQKYGYDEETIDNISQHERHINTKKLLDYITNLQEENKRLKEIENFKFWLRKDETKEPVTIIKSYKKEYEDYKSRNEKAIEYLRELEMFERKFGFDGVRRKKLLNILQGDDKSE